MKIVFLLLAILLLTHSVRDFLQYKNSDMWLAKIWHKESKAVFDKTVKRIGLGWLKDKELIHSLICLSFGIIFLIMFLELR